MEQFGLALILFAAFWVGCAASYIAMRLRCQVFYDKGRMDSAAEIAGLQERLNGREQQFNELRQRSEAGAAESVKMETELRAESERRKSAESGLALQKQELMRLHSQISELSKRPHTPEPAAVAPAAPNLAMIGELVEPLKSSLDRVDVRLGELERERAAAYAGLQQQVESLASALRTPPARGNWGEVQLRRVVELAGMIAHCDFVEPLRTGIAGDVTRPDLIVRLPNHRQIVVDSGIPLTAYVEANESADESVRGEMRKQHAAAVRAHLTRLGDSGYWAQFPQAPEFVVAFLPGESLLSAALDSDPELLDFGVGRRVILATPATLIALLHAVAWGWKQELASADAQEIRDIGKAMYERLHELAGSFTELQRHLTDTAVSFNRTVGSFETGLMPAARRMHELGVAKEADTTPQSLSLLAGAAESEQCEDIVKVS